jgi:hypothetical protein
MSAQPRYEDDSRIVPRPNDDVVTLMGEPVGTVVGVVGGYFKVQTHLGVRTAPIECIFKRVAGRVTLICDRSGLGRYFRDC